MKKSKKIKKATVNATLGSSSRDAVETAISRAKNRHCEVVWENQLPTTRFTRWGETVQSRCANGDTDDSGDYSSVE